ncbi:hypothetical protein [uncultured Porphyromonas sp.]|uniref:hypothetical protein n=1 Tax=uncultured Porphyromonas sp. TaxID=159274 RepID=UPI0028055E32|nr:hypothetical protein [uncultured Porphyromonas sp.]
MRTPLIVCNIGHEVALEAGDPLHYTPPRLIRQIRSALWSLPLWAVPAWLDGASWWVHPFSESLSPYLTDRELSHIAKGNVGNLELILWGHERSLAHSLAKQYGLSGGETYSELPQELMPCWTRAASARFFAKYSSVPWRSRVAMMTQIEELVELLTQGPCLVKLPYSSSGRGLWRINRLDSQLEETLRKLLRRHGTLLVEPLLDKMQDYGAEYYIDEAGEVQFVGLSAFETDDQGRYLESLCQAPEETLRQLTESLSDPNELTQALAQHRAYLSREVAPYYCGAVGIDLLTYRPDGVSSRTALHPWVEINLRYTMGHYALDLYRERVPQGSYDQYRFGILSAPRAKALLSTADAPTLDDTGCLCSGLLPLTSTDLTTASHFAYLRTL